MDPICTGLHDAHLELMFNPFFKYPLEILILSLSVSNYLFAQGVLIDFPYLWDDCLITNTWVIGCGCVCLNMAVDLEEGLTARVKTIDCSLCLRQMLMEPERATLFLYSHVYFQ